MNSALQADSALATLEQSGSGQGRLASTIAVHAVVDFFSAIIIPILTVLLGRLHLQPGQDAAVIALGSITSGVIQPVVAWASDRYDTRWLGTVGVVAAAIAIGAVGFVRPEPVFGMIGGFGQLLILQAVGAAGIGAFHPVAAAAVGRLSGRRRSLGVSIFYVSGMIGGIAGSITSPHWVKWFGLPALAAFILPGLLAALLLRWAIHGVAHRAADAHERHAALPEAQRRQRWRGVWLLYAGNVLRFTVNMALIQLLVRWSEQEALRRSGAAVLSPEIRTLASTVNGTMMAAMAVGMAIGGLAAGFTVRAHHEKGSLIAIPILGAIGIAVFPLCGRAPTPAMVTLFGVGLAAVAGWGYGGVIPVTISLAQRLLPHRTSLASGMMMGGAWMLAAIGPFMARGLNLWLGLDRAFAAVGLMLALSGLLSVFLRRSLILGTAER